MFTDRNTLRQIERLDPDGWSHREPTERDHDDFRAWVIASYGADAWADYSLGGWDEGEGSTW